jgi:replicative superfamily II helicase
LRILSPHWPINSARLGADQEEHSATRLVDFRKRLAKKDAGKRIDPIELYDTLDRASDKGELRTAQREILAEWHASHRNAKDIIIKLHTGQGKTLIGLLVLQSKLNEGKGPALYLCPNNFLIRQTFEQAKQFGITLQTADSELPSEFLDGQAILLTSVQKLFNGFSKFGIGTKSLSVGSVLMDDSHACIDAIRDAFCLRLTNEHPIFQGLLTLFAQELEEQGAGTFADIREGNGNDLLPVPYWAWEERQSDVVKLIAKHTSSNEVKFVWPLIKDGLAECECIVSSRGLEIAPYLVPLELFGSFYRASHRVFMSATVTDDSFLIRGLQLSPEVVRAPLTYSKEKWSGEKMILIPSLIDESLSRDVVVKEFAPPKSRSYGVVALTPSFAGTKDWAKYGALVVDTNTINSAVEELRNRRFDRALVIANRYDGIDLPDDTCRILNFDSKPYTENLIDRYSEMCRTFSDATATRIARAIEQGLGRSVRGEEDYCVIIISGAELVAAVRSPDSRRHLSSQTRKQVDIGLEIASLAKEDLGNEDPLSCLRGLISQSVKRDQGWKDFYAERMDSIEPELRESQILLTFQKELEAE